MDSQLLAFIIAIFTAITIILVFFGIMYANKNSKGEDEFLDRLKALNKSELDDREEENTSMVARWDQYWDLEALRSGIHQPPGTIGRNVLIGMIIAMLAGIFIIEDGLMFGIIGAGVVPIAARSFFQSAKKKREKRLTDQIPYFIGQMRSNIQANSTPQRAILAVVNDIPAPLGIELQLLKDDIDVGISLDEALDRLMERVPARELRFICQSIKIANTSGSDLEPQLVTINDVVESRRAIASKLQTAIASVSTAIWLSIIAIPAFFLFSFFATEGASKFWFSMEGLPYLAVVAGLYIVSIFATRMVINQVQNF